MLRWTMSQRSNIATPRPAAHLSPRVIGGPKALVLPLRPIPPAPQPTHHPLQNSQPPGLVPATGRFFFARSNLRFSLRLGCGRLGRVLGRTLANGAMGSASSASASSRSDRWPPLGRSPLEPVDWLQPPHQVQPLPAPHRYAPVLVGARVPARRDPFAARLQALLSAADQSQFRGHPAHRV